MAADGSGLPYELWRGLDVATLSAPDRRDRHPAALAGAASAVAAPHHFQRHTARRRRHRPAVPRAAPGDPLPVGPAAGGGARRSPTMPAGDPTRRHPRRPQRDRPRRPGPRLRDGAQRAAPRRSSPSPCKADAALISGFCAAVAGDAPGAGLAAELAREAGVTDSPGLQALDAISMGAKPQVAPDQPSLAARLSADRSGWRRDRYGASPQARQGRRCSPRWRSIRRGARASGCGRRSCRERQRHLAAAARRHLSRATLGRHRASPTLPAPIRRNGARRCSSPPRTKARRRRRCASSAPSSTRRIAPASTSRRCA